MIYEYLTKQRGIRILFVESLCTDPNIIEANILVRIVHLFAAESKQMLYL